MKKVVLTSDLTGKHPARTLEFSVDGRGYEVDLTESEIREVKKSLSDLIRIARSLSDEQGKVRKARQTGHTAAEVRAWAKREGITTPSKGRLPNSLLKQFLEAHSLTR